MNLYDALSKLHGTRFWQTWRGPLVSVAVVTCSSICGFDLALAQSDQLGSYQGIIKVSGTQTGPEVSYQASIKISLPVTDRDDDSIDAEFYSGEAPLATVTITQWDEAHTEKSPGLDGKFASYTCKLAGPKEISMTPTGVLNVDLEQQVHMLSLTLLGTSEVEFDCVHSHSGPYKRKKSLVLYVGTGTPGMQFEHPIAFTDAAHLTANYTLVTNPAETNAGPINQEWDLQLSQ